MKLSSLITEANRTYGLGLADPAVQEVYRRLKAAGYRDVVTNAATTLDAVFKTTDGLNRGPQAVYAGMKAEVTAATDACPRCQQDIRVVALVGDRPAHYCQSCAITLPIKV